MTTKIADSDPLKEVRKAFSMFDQDKTGFITIKNLRLIMKEVKDQEKKKAEEATAKEIKNMECPEE